MGNSPGPFREPRVSNRSIARPGGFETENPAARPARAGTMGEAVELGQRQLPHHREQPDQAAGEGGDYQVGERAGAVGGLQGETRIHGSCTSACDIANSRGPPSGAAREKPASRSGEPHNGRTVPVLKRQGPASGVLAAYA